jgi:hypothetical protein
VTMRVPVLVVALERGRPGRDRDCRAGHAVDELIKLIS